MESSSSLSPIQNQKIDRPSFKRKYVVFLDLLSSETMIIMIGKFWKGLASQAIHRYTWKALWSPHPLSADPIVVFIWLIKSPHVASLANHQETCLPALILFCGRWKEREECTGEIIRVSMTELWGHRGEGGLNISRSKCPPPPQLHCISAPPLIHLSHRTLWNKVVFEWRVQQSFEDLNPVF